MLCDLSELSALVTGSENIENFLQRTVALVSGHLGTPVCSIYLYDETADELVLKADGLDHNDQPAIGMMVELPSVVETMAEFAAEADFFTIGTNDLVQYMLGVDRSNKRVADYYRPEHPSVLRTLARMVNIAADHGKPISVCGEMGHDGAMIPFLLGIGIRRLSIDPQFMPAVHQCIAGLAIDPCRDHARMLLSAGSIDAVQKMLAEF
jgi:phosphotransferase system enzyme I (PtsP)